ncbi:MAG: FAD-binding oxidoreductase [Gammaproteobacteria bacterium]
MMSADFLCALSGILPADEVLDQTGSAQSMLVDERAQYIGQAIAIVAPKATSRIAAVVRLCAQHGIPIVPQGGNTGYCGGATPDRSGTQLVLSLKNMNRCRELDTVGRTITVEAGMVLQDAQQAAAEQGLLFPLSMGSEGSCQIGGNLSTNAGGLAVLRYGTARDLVLGLEVVTPAGEILNELKTLRKDTTGYDLKHLFVGAEGTLGVITAACLKLFPRPTATQVCWLAVPGETILAPLLRCLQDQIGDAVSSFEYISRPSLDYVLTNIDSTRDPFPTRYKHYALVEFGGFGEQARFSEACEQALISAQQQAMLDDAVIARSEQQTRALWQLRELIPRAEKLLGGSLKHDVSVPISQMSTLISALKNALMELDSAAKLSIYGHVGDGNVHFNVLPPSGVSYEDYKRTRGAEVSARIHEIAAQNSGSFSAEHGVGQLKTSELEKYGSAESLELMKTLKRALDPQHIMNPGKVLNIEA